MRNFTYQVQEMVYDAKSLQDEQNFYNQNQGEVSKLTSKLTYIMGDRTKKFPISMMTMGNIASPSASVELDDVQFTYPVMGREDKASPCSSTIYTSTDRPGIGHSEFYLWFPDNWIKRYYIIQSSRGIQAYVLEDPIKDGDQWKYKVQLDPADEDDYCPISEVQRDCLWIELNTQVAESESRGTRSKSVAPGLWKNQMGFIRASMEWAGNAANKVMNITMSMDGKESKGWMDFFMWQFEQRWLNECEHVSWYSRYNRLADGSIPLKDLLTGKVIPRGSGLLEQIFNKSTFSKLTYSSLVNKIGDALFGQSDSEGMTITLHTGLGGMRDFDQAMKEEGVKILTDYTGVAEKFITGSGRELALGGFFTQFYHVDGYLIKVKHNPIFDHGRIALISPKHPETGFPLESHRLVFIDDSDYDGQPNITHVAQKNRSFLHGIVPGLTPPPRSLAINGGFNLNGDAVQILTDEGDRSSYHRFKSSGIQMLRATKSFDMQCVAGL